MPKLKTDNTGNTRTSVPWAVVIAAVAVLPGVFIPVPAMHDFFYLPKLLLLFGLELSLTVLLLLRQVRRRGCLFKTRNPLAAPLWAYLAVLAVSTWTSINPNRSLLGEPLRWEGLAAFLLYGGLVLLLPLAAQSEPVPAGVRGSGHSATDRIAAQVELLLRWGAFIMALIVVYGVMQRYGLDPAPRDPVRAGAAWWSTSAFTTLGNSNFLGSFAATYLLLTSVRYVCAPKDEPGWFWLGGAGFAYYGLLTALSRGAWLAAGAAFLGVMLLLAVLRLLPEGRRLLLLAGVLIALTLVWHFADPLASQRVTQLVQDTAHQSGTVAQRLWIWHGTWRAVLARPWLGWGLDSLIDVFPLYEPAGRAAVGLTGWLIDRAHNDFLQVAVSSGLLGLAAYLWLLWGAARAGWRMLRNPGVAPLSRSLTLALLAAGMAHLLALATNISTVSESPTFWGFLGLLAVLAASDLQDGGISVDGIDG